jgi:hypothetical protein
MLGEAAGRLGYIEWHRPNAGSFPIERARTDRAEYLIKSSGWFTQPCQFGVQVLEGTMVMNGAARRDPSPGPAPNDTSGLTRRRNILSD